VIVNTVKDPKAVVLTITSISKKFADGTPLAKVFWIILMEKSRINNVTWKRRKKIEDVEICILSVR
jgi:hypothetical protein